MGDMSRDSLRTDLVAQLGAAASGFDPADHDRHLDQAADALGRRLPLRAVGTLTLVADRSDYPAPADLVVPLYGHWGRAERRQYQPWDKLWPGRLPRLARAEHDANTLWLEPAPTAAQIARLGSSYEYSYVRRYVIAADAADTTVPAHRRDLLLLRAVANALHERAADLSTKPVELGRIGGSMPRNGHPAALANALLKRFDAETRGAAA